MKKEKERRDISKQAVFVAKSLMTYEITYSHLKNPCLGNMMVPAMIQGSTKQCI
ncbi:hypothetical protein MKC73_10080 [[Clostridium] innocuum]|nr:hypothetical protein [[Clostridium] innocuum]